MKYCSILFPGRRARARHVCSFCGLPAALAAGRISLCAACEAQVISLNPSLSRYDWFVAALTRARRRDK